MFYRLGLASGSLSQSCNTYDIGQVANSVSLKSLTKSEKFKILKNHFKPTEQFNFPRKFLQGCSRDCKVEYLCDTFVYKESEDGVYCIYCSLFLTKDLCKSLKAFVNNGFSNWYQFFDKKTETWN